MKVLIIGATGRTGRRVTRRALDNGHQVTALVRTPSKLDITGENLVVEQGNIRDYNSFASALHDQDAVISTIGTESFLHSVDLYSEGMRNILRAMKEYDVSRLLAITSGGTYPGWSEHGSLFFELVFKRLLLRGAYKDMRRMEEMMMDSDLEWTIVRPSTLIDDKGVGNYRTKVGYSFAESIETKRDDLAEFIVEELDSKQFVREGVAVVSVD